MVLSYIFYPYPLQLYFSYPYNKNQQDALFTFNLFQLLTFTCFEQAYCSSSGDTTLHIQLLVYAMRLC